MALREKIRRLLKGLNYEQLSRLTESRVYIKFFQLSEKCISNNDQIHLLSTYLHSPSAGKALTRSRAYRQREQGRWEGENNNDTFPEDDDARRSLFLAEQIRDVVHRQMNSTTNPQSLLTFASPRWVETASEMYMILPSGAITKMNPSRVCERKRRLLSFDCGQVGRVSLWTRARLDLCEKVTKKAIRSFLRVSFLIKSSLPKVNHV